MDPVMQLESNLEWWTDQIPDLSWTFAKTMADVPHSYIVRGKHLDDEAFERAVRTIRTYGEPGKFYRRTHIYHQVGDQKYWTMGAPLWKTKIINRAEAGKTYGRQDAPRTFTGHRDEWDVLAPDYDDTHEYAKESEVVRSALVKLSAGQALRILDVGCGTGRVLDWQLTHPAFWVGVDSSQGMLNEMVRKANREKRSMGTIIPGRAEDVDLPKGADLGVALFGSASYFQTSVLERMVQSCRALALMPVRGGPNDDFCQSIPGARVTPVGDFNLIIKES